MPSMRRMVFGNKPGSIRFMSDEAIRNATQGTLLWAMNPELDPPFTKLVQSKCREELARRRNGGA